MGKKFETKINNFSGGISDDVRQNSANQYGITKHFNIFAGPNKLVPYRNTVADTSDGSVSTQLKQYLVQDFFLTSQGWVYGLGRKAASSHTKLFYKTSVLANWTIPASSESALALVRGCFFEYNDYGWGFESTNKVFQYGLISGTPVYSANAATLSQTILTVANGLIGKDGLGYMFYNNIVVKVSGTTVTEALTLPAHFKITSATKLGSYLVIACAPKAGLTGRSSIFLWDYASSIAEPFDFGEGNLMVIENIDGRIVGISDRSETNSGFVPQRAIVIREYTGGGSIVLKEVFIKDQSNTPYLKQYKGFKNNRLYFLASVGETASIYHEGIWVYGRKNSSSPYSLTVDFVEEAAVSGKPINSFAITGDYYEISYDTDGSVTRTVNDSTSFTFTSIYESQRFGIDSTRKKKKLVGVTVTHEPLPTSQTVLLSYKKDEDTSFTTIFTNSTDNSQTHSAINIESSGANLPEFNEIQFRIQSANGSGAITGLELTYEVLEKDLY